MVERLADEDPLVAESAAEALANIGGRDVAARLVPILTVDQALLRNRGKEVLRRLAGEAPDLILQLLDESDPDLRIFAAELLGEVSAPGVGRALIKALKSPDPNLRLAAALSLGKRRETSAVGALVERLDDEEWVRFAAIDALSNIGDPAALEPLMKAMKNNSGVIQTRIARALGGFKDPRVCETLLETLQDAEGPTLNTVVNSMLKVGGARALRHLDEDLKQKAAKGLIDALSEPYEQSKTDILLGLGILKDKASVVPILEMARSGQKSDILEMAKMALSAIGEVAPLVAAAKDSHAKVAETAVIVLGRLGGKDARNALMEALNHPVAAVRREAVRALGEIGGTDDTLSSLENALKDPARAVVLEAAHALGQLGGASVVPALAGLLDSPDGDVRNKSWNALVSIASDEVRGLFIKGLGNPDASYRELCASGLAPLGPGDGGRELKKALKDPETKVRAQAAAALMEVEGENALPDIEMILGDEDVEVRAHAARALARQKWSKAPDLLIKALGDSHLSVRQEAVRGLGRMRAVRAVEPLAMLLQENPSGELAVDVARALGNIGGEVAAEPLLDLLCHQDSQVRKAAADSLQRIAGGWEQYTGDEE